MAKQNWDVKAFVAGQVALGRDTLAGARKRLGRVDVQLQQAFLQLGQDAELQTQMATVMGRMQALKESVEQVAECLEAMVPGAALTSQNEQPSFLSPARVCERVHLARLLVVLTLSRANAKVRSWGKAPLQVKVRHVALPLL